MGCHFHDAKVDFEIGFRTRTVHFQLLEFLLKLGNHGIKVSRYEDSLDLVLLHCRLHLLHDRLFGREANFLKGEDTEKTSVNVLEVENS